MCERVPNSTLNRAKPPRNPALYPQSDTRHDKKALNMKISLTTDGKGSKRGF